MKIQFNTAHKITSQLPYPPILKLILFLTALYQLNRFGDARTKATSASSTFSHLGHDDVVQHATGVTDAHAPRLDPAHSGRADESNLPSLCIARDQKGISALHAKYCRLCEPIHEKRVLGVEPTTREKT